MDAKFAPQTHLRRLLTVAVIALAGMSGIGRAQVSTNAESLLLAQLSGFKVGHQSLHGDRSLAQWVPVGESMDHWTQMLTVQVDRHSTADPAAYLQGVSRRWASVCPSSTREPVSGTHLNGYTVSTVLIRCPKYSRTGKPETTVIRAIKGNDALYVIQRAYRSLPSDHDLNDAMSYLADVTVCDSRDPAHHPCPAFASAPPGK